jgi:hypothetical protein
MAVSHPSIPNPEDDSHTYGGVPLQEIATALDQKPRSFVPKLQAAALARKNLEEELEGATLVQAYSRKSGSKYNTEFIGKIHNWVLNHCTKVIASPNLKDSKFVPVLGDPKMKGKKGSITTHFRSRRSTKR